MKKLKFILIMMLLPLFTTGCFKWDNMEDINIITTVYPIEYVVNFIYGDNSTVTSVYPKSVNVLEYQLTDKQIKDF